MRDMRQREYHSSQLHWRAITTICNVPACVKRVDLWVFNTFFSKIFMIPRDEAIKIAQVLFVDFAWFLLRCLAKVRRKHEIKKIIASSSVAYRWTQPLDLCWSLEFLFSRSPFRPLSHLPRSPICCGPASARKSYSGEHAVPPRTLAPNLRWVYPLELRQWVWE